MSITALVTGANKGIGFSVIQQLSAKLPKDSVIYLGARDLEKGKDAKAKVDSKNVKIELLQIDIEDEKSVTNAAAEVKRKSGGLDLLICNAGFAFPLDSKDTFQVQAKKTIDINVYGSLRCYHHFFPLLKDHAKVITVGSQAGQLAKKDKSSEPRLFEMRREDITIKDMEKFIEEFRACESFEDAQKKGFGKSTYSVSKVILNQITRIIGKDLKENGTKNHWNIHAKDVHVSVCCPGWCHTDMGGKQAPRTPDQGAEVVTFLSLLKDDKVDTFNGLWVDNKCCDW